MFSTSSQTEAALQELPNPQSESKASEPSQLIAVQSSIEDKQLSKIIEIIDTLPKVVMSYNTTLEGDEWPTIWAKFLYDRAGFATDPTGDDFSPLLNIYRELTNLQLGYRQRKFFAGFENPHQRFYPEAYDKYFNHSFFSIARFHKAIKSQKTEDLEKLLIVLRFIKACSQFDKPVESTGDFLFLDNFIVEVLASRKISKNKDTLEEEQKEDLAKIYIIEGEDLEAAFGLDDNSSNAAVTKKPLFFTTFSSLVPLEVKTEVVQAPMNIGLLAANNAPPQSASNTIKAEDALAESKTVADSHKNNGPVDVTNNESVSSLDTKKAEQTSAESSPVVDGQPLQSGSNVSEKIVAEPVQISLSSNNHPDGKIVLQDKPEDTKSNGNASDEAKNSNNSPATSQKPGLNTKKLALGLGVALLSAGVFALSFWIAVPTVVLFCFAFGLAIGAGLVSDSKGCSQDQNPNGRSIVSQHTGLTVNPNNQSLAHENQHSALGVGQSTVSNNNGQTNLSQDFESKADNGVGNIKLPRQAENKRSTLSAQRGNTVSIIRVISTNKSQSRAPVSANGVFAPRNQAVVAASQVRATTQAQSVFAGVATRKPLGETQQGVPSKNGALAPKNPVVAVSKP